MADILIQFHALPEELEPLIREAFEGGLHAVAFYAHPAPATQLTAERVAAALRDATLRSIAFTVEHPMGLGGTTASFVAKHSDALTLDVGHRSERGLHESCLSARTGSETALKHWKRIARRLRAVTEAGATAVNPRTGATVAIPGHRFTAAAKALDQEGVPILPVAGTARLHFGRSGTK